MMIKGEPDYAASPLQQAQIGLSSSILFSGLERSDKNMTIALLQPS